MTWSKQARSVVAVQARVSVSPTGHALRQGLHAADRSASANVPSLHAAQTASTRAKGNWAVGTLLPRAVPRGQAKHTASLLVDPAVCAHCWLPSAYRAYSAVPHDAWHGVHHWPPPPFANAGRVTPLAPVVLIDLCATALKVWAAHGLHASVSGPRAGHEPVSSAPAAHCVTPHFAHAVPWYSPCPWCSAAPQPTHDPLAVLVLLDRRWPRPHLGCFAHAPPVKASDAAWYSLAPHCTHAAAAPSSRNPFLHDAHWPSSVRSPRGRGVPLAHLALNGTHLRLDSLWPALHDPQCPSCRRSASSARLPLAQSPANGSHLNALFLPEQAPVRFW